jgi:hypothetical protein
MWFYAGVAVTLAGLTGAFVVEASTPERVIPRWTAILGVVVAGAAAIHVIALLGQVRSDGWQCWGDHSCARVRFCLAHVPARSASGGSNLETHAWCSLKVTATVKAPEGMLLTASSFRLACNPSIVSRVMVDSNTSPRRSFTIATAPRRT